MGISTSLSSACGKQVVREGVVGKFAGGSLLVIVGRRGRRKEPMDALVDDSASCIYKQVTREYTGGQMDVLLLVSIESRWQSEWLDG